MNIREDVIYARQSVDRKDSISIESQIDFCKYELKGGSCRVFKDKGYSGKNTDRPEFQKLLGEIRKGKVRRVVVYKLDRISRSILDFSRIVPVGKSERTAPGKRRCPFVLLHASGQVGPRSGLPVFAVVRRLLHGAEVKDLVELGKHLPNVL